MQKNVRFFRRSVGHFWGNVKLFSYQKLVIFRRMSICFCFVSVLKRVFSTKLIMCGSKIPRPIMSLSVHRAVLSVHRAVLSVYRALLSVYRALLSVYRALLSV